MTPFKKRCAVLAFGCAFVAGVLFGRMLPERGGSTPVVAAVDFQELPNWDSAPLMYEVSAR